MGKFPALGFAFPTMTEFAPSRRPPGLAGQRVGRNIPLANPTTSPVEAVKASAGAEGTMFALDPRRELRPAMQISAVVMHSSLLQ
jgi:hypothetical protein